MALRRPPAPAVRQIVETSDEPTSAPVAGMRSLVAAAAQLQLDNQSTTRARLGSEEWMREAWRQMDITGELRYLANRNAASIGQVRLYVATVDDEGRAGEEAKEPEIRAIGESLFGGGPATKAEYLRTIALHLYVVGESYVVAESRPGGKRDIWYVVTREQIRRSRSRDGGYDVRRPDQYGGGWANISGTKGLITRCWTPHPRDYDVADSPVRAALPILREIERLVLLTFSQIDSRLISAGLLLLPQNINFPGKGEAESGLAGLMEMLMKVATAQLTGAGTAAGLLPIMGEIPAGTGNDIQHVKFETALAAEIKDKLDHAIRRLATALDCAPEDLLGQGKSNHWSAWQISEDGIKLYVQPPVTRICDAMYRSYVGPHIARLGKDPDRYMLVGDPSALTVRPNRFEDAIQLWDRGEISGDELRRSGNFSDETEMATRERAAWMAWTLIKTDPGLLKNAELVKLAGLPESVAQQEEHDHDHPAALPPGEQSPEAPTDGRALPQQPASTESPAQDGDGDRLFALLPGAEQVVLRALELAGGRMLDRHSRGRYADVDKFALHTRISIPDRDRAEQLLVGAFAHVPALARHHGLPADRLEWVLGQYCTELLVRGYPHSPELLNAMLRGSPVGAFGG